LRFIKPILEEQNISSVTTVHFRKNISVVLDKDYSFVTILNFF